MTGNKIRSSAHKEVKVPSPFHEAISKVSVNSIMIDLIYTKCRSKKIGDRSHPDLDARGLGITGQIKTLTQTSVQILQHLLISSRIW